VNITFTAQKVAVLANVKIGFHRRAARDKKVRNKIMMRSNLKKIVVNGYVARICCSQSEKKKPRRGIAPWILVNCVGQ
jgi:hypothetical protein